MNSTERAKKLLYEIIKYEKDDSVNSWNRDKVENILLKLSKVEIDDISKSLGEYYGLYHFDKVDINVFKEGCKNLSENGYYIFDKKLDSDTCESIIDQLKSIKFKTVGGDNKIINGFNYNNIYKIKGNTCKVINHNDIINIHEVQEVIYNPTILAIIQNYLESIPIHQQANCWWSINFSNSNNYTSVSAQKYHQDRNVIKFVKVFIYLNDVDEKNGAHSYVKGSNNGYEKLTPKNYRIRSRMSDKYINKVAGDRIVKHVGEKGTIILEDTAGIHKGSPVIEGYRILLQFEYCCSLYFHGIGKFDKNVLNNDSKQFMSKYPRIFANYK